MPRNDNKCNKFILIRTKKNVMPSWFDAKKKKCAYVHVIELVSRVKYTNEAKLKPFDLHFCLCVSFHASMTIYHELQLFNPHSTLTQLLLLLLVLNIIYERITQFCVCYCMHFSILCDFFHSIFATHTF